MSLHTKARLAVHAMLDLALREASGPVVLASIAQRQRVSLSSTEQVFSRLRAAGLVRSTRGVGGGYSVADIVAAAAAGTAAASAYQRRPTLADDFSQRLDAVMHAHMAGIALADLVAGQHKAGVMVQARPRRGAVEPQALARHIAVDVPNSVFELGSARATPGASPYRP